MMLMGGKKIPSLVIEKLHGAMAEQTDSENGEPAKDYSEALNVAAHEMMNAIDKKDVHQFKVSLMNFLAMCEELEDEQEESSDSEMGE